jgi:hypothetical protein
VGSAKDTFNAGESVYTVGMGFPASSTFDISIVADVVSWTSMSGLPIPTSLSADLQNVTSDASGMITVSLLWASPTLGNYDIVVDVNRNGVYDPGIDAVDSDNVATAGLSVVPELGVIALLGMFASSIVVVEVRRRGKRLTNT